MIVSRCCRCALEATRPAKRTNLSIRPLARIRMYAAVTEDSKHHGHDQIGSKLKTIAGTQSSNPDLIEQVQQPPNRPPPEIDPESSEISSQLKRATIGDEEPERPTAPNVAAAFRTPYKHTPQHGIPVAQLQLRSYSVRNLEFMADFALRVAYYLKLPATGPAPLPKRIERWTTIRSNFVHKKSQENFERITMKRLITVYDGHPDVVELWLACLRKWQFYGVGMKANVWSFEELHVAQNMDRQLDAIRKDLDAKLANFGWKDASPKNKSVHEMLLRQGRRVQGSPLMSNRDKIANVKNVELFDHVTDDMQKRKL